MDAFISVYAGLWYLFALYTLVAVMKLRLDTKQVEHYFDVWVAQRRKVLAEYIKGALDFEQYETALEAVDRSYDTHRLAVYGF